MDNLLSKKIILSLIFGKKFFKLKLLIIDNSSTTISDINLKLLNLNLLLTINEKELFELNFNFPISCCGKKV